jgi:hypothetical protein
MPQARSLGSFTLTPIKYSLEEAKGSRKKAQRVLLGRASIKISQADSRMILSSVRTRMRKKGCRRTYLNLGCAPRGSLSSR